ncbi:hypothetical protein JAAARDRAFT_413073 [Jaapia argillacea MUCL 33604]|uniref:Vacuolar protein sorting-associated protein 51 homolog n=1 Tax=Jaapia argillacea MUCL 33604 TaxID=933084 RepID=A0A067PUY4_9AGAM|nr:hypothetical protein JAAARDRAFT_413073 [Jaapia argillacea MUCL 33604]
MTMSSLVPTLTKRANEILSEIRQLGSERQSLVYNHHHQLIAESDTIAAVDEDSSRIPRCRPGPPQAAFSERYRG